MPIISHHKCLTFQLRTAAVVFFLNAKNSCLYLLFFLFVPLFIGFLFNTFLFLPIRFSIYMFLSFSSCFSSFLFSYVSVPLILFFISQFVYYFLLSTEIIFILNLTFLVLLSFELYLSVMLILYLCLIIGFSILSVSFLFCFLSLQTHLD
jgi:hypothetical protein